IRAVARCPGEWRIGLTGTVPFQRMGGKPPRSSHNPLSLVEAGRRILVVASLGLLLSCLTACAIRSTSSGSPTILLFNGSGTSPNDVAAIEKILNENDFSYTTANSQQL